MALSVSLLMTAVAAYRRFQQLATSMAVFWVAALLSALAPARKAARVPPVAATRSA